MLTVRNVIIMGAAGRDFHNFNTFFRDNPAYKVRAFTAFQIPNIAGRTYPSLLAGKLYPEGIPIYEEKELFGLIQKENIHEVVFAYSDISNQEVMERAALVNRAGADFVLMGAKTTMLTSKKPVISVCAVRTGCGKSQTARSIADILNRFGKKAAVIRHPMPYGNLLEQRCQKFSTLEDLRKYDCTIEEREEYELHIEKGHLLYAGVDYAEILNQAEKEADVLLWDGGNNDLPFYKPDLHIVLTDPFRPGHELTYYPSQANFQMAQVILISKTNTAPHKGVQSIRENIQKYNPTAEVVEAESVVQVDFPDRISGKNVLVIEDGPTLTHGGMPFGAGTIAARKFGARKLVDPRPYAVGTIRQTLEHFPHLENVLPAMGYNPQQLEELKQTIQLIPCDTVVVGTPFNLSTLLGGSKNIVRVNYDLDEKTNEKLTKIVERFLKK